MCTLTMRFDKITDKQPANFAMAIQHNVGDHIKTENPCCQFGGVSTVRFATLSLNHRGAATRWKSMEIVHCGKTGDTGDNEFRAAAKANGTVRIDTTQTDFKIRVRDDTVEIHRCAVLKVAKRTQVPTHKVMIGDFVLGSDICANLFHNIFIGERSMGTHACNKPNL